MTCTETTVLPEPFYKSLMDSIFDAVYTVNNHGIITYWNHSCTRITGYTADEMIGQQYRAAFSPNLSEPADQQGHLDIVLKTGMPGAWKGYISRKTGQRIPIESHISPIRDDAQNIIGVAQVFRDISAQIALEQSHLELVKISRNDQLTGLYNRSAIGELLKAEIERSLRYRQPLSLIMIDLDYFKAVNDRYGHDAGDCLLQALGSLLLHNLRQPDAPGRWGGEEFLILTPGSEAAATGQLAERIRGYIKQIAIPEVPQLVTASFGVCQLGLDQTHDQFLNTADRALYQAKDAGRDRVVIAPPES